MRRTCCYRLMAACVLLVLATACRPTREASEDAVALPLAQRDAAEDGKDADCWAGFRGAEAQGVAAAGDPAVEFSSTSGFRWKVELPGDGWSSPVVWRDRVLLTTALPTSEPPTLALLCYDRKDGQLLWQADAGKAAGASHTKNGYASATPATDGQRIVVSFGSGGLFCYDFDGRPLWKVELGKLEHQWGTASSPVLHGNLVLQLCDSQDDSSIRAFDKTDGSEVWRTSRPSDGCWSTPIVIEAETGGGKRRMEVVVNGCGTTSHTVNAYALEDGRELWSVEGLTDFVSPTPSFAGGLLYCASGRNGPVLAIEPGGEGDVTDTRERWRLRRGGPYVPSGVVYRNRLYLVTEPGYIYCYNAGDGTEIWKTRLRDTFTASLVAAAGRIYATSERGRVYVLAAGDTVEMIAENDMGERCLATPAVAGGELFVRTSQHLYCIPNQ